ncbi:DUF5819 family protein [uncultured Aeromicrobium sp.]|uniref:DUF5819 family protein n=1 Tax=uncultured Aeromicrobium sp. TaxID=337820 RepID=UPI0025E21523|nr:DUF5819 family protein [uncultured Aeromicrobium sp.]
MAAETGHRTPYLNTYLPVFDQNWRIFAPTPRRAAVTFEIRASIGHGADQIVTDWTDLVEREDELIRGNVAPSRMALAARRTANTLTSVSGRMNEEQRRQVEANYLTTPVEELRSRLHAIDGGASSSDIDRYMLYDRIATALATMYAASVWDGEITHVQYRTSIRYVPPFESRAEVTIDDAEPTSYAYGWRATTPPPEEVVEMFAVYAGETRS